MFQKADTAKDFILAARSKEEKAVSDELLAKFNVKDYYYYCGFFI